MTPEEQFLDQLPVIERVTAAVCRRHCCFGDEAEEFEARVKLKLIDDDYAVLRKFRGKSALATYLTTVIHNLFRDYRISRWGKWRPSSAARRLGPVAVQLETLIARDGFEFAQAAEILRANHKVEESEDRLAEIAGRLPARPPRRFEGEEGLAEVGAADGVERRVTDGEKAATLHKTEAALNRALADFDPEDRLLLRMRYQDGLTVAAIARSFGWRPRRLYSHFESCLRRLREALESEGLRNEEVRGILGWEGTELGLDFGVRRGNPPVSSVKPEGGL